MAESEIALVSDYPKDKYFAKFDINHALDEDATAQLGPEKVVRQDEGGNDVVVKLPRYSVTDVVATIKARKEPCEVLKTEVFRSDAAPKNPDQAKAMRAANKLAAGKWLKKEMEQYRIPEEE